MDDVSLGKLQRVARDWQRYAESDLRQLPQALGLQVGTVDEIESSLLGFSVQVGRVKQISFNKYLEGSELEPLVLAHEVSHFVVGLCEGGFETCGDGQITHGCETLAWCGAALLMLPHATSQEPRCDGISPQSRFMVPLGYLRLAIADHLGEVATMGIDLEAAVRLLARTASVEARFLRRDANRTNLLTSRIAV